MRRDPEEGTLTRQGGPSILRPLGSLEVSGPCELIALRGVRGAYEPDGRLAVETTRLMAEGKKPPDAVPGRLPGRAPVQVRGDDVVWGGPLTFHYGHFLTESVSRLWPLLPGGVLEGLPVVWSDCPSHPIMDEWLKAFDIRVTTLPLSGPVRFTNMFVPEPAWRLDTWVAAEIRSIHLQARRGLEVPSRPRAGVLWLSRSGLSRWRRAYDEVLLEWLLGEHVVSIRPEAMSLAEQISAIEGSEAVAGIVGSAFHSLLMAETLPRCVYICGGRLRETHLAQTHLLNVDAGFVQALALMQPRGDGRKSFPHGYRVLIPEVLRALGESVLPGIKQDPWLAAFAYPERLSAKMTGSTVSALGKAVARVLLDPSSMSARMWLGAAFADEGLHHCALEQYLTVAELSDEHTVRAPLYAARMLSRMGRAEEADAMAKQVLAVDPSSREAAGYLLGS
jgi:hypothetical protein